MTALPSMHIFFSRISNSDISLCLVFYALTIDHKRITNCPVNTLKHIRHSIKFIFLDTHCLELSDLLQSGLAVLYVWCTTVILRSPFTIILVTPIHLSFLFPGFHVVFFLGLFPYFRNFVMHKNILSQPLPLIYCLARCRFLVRNHFSSNM